ncbi:hypothetical protein O1611_g6860 [Lasiodiplodia mahajangana]|uniref:Uncharacterized protein n=1 Tax=Lasiodiplodia mahajangana TaxID=1108764 RepID=A0ACC2JHR5_9PEZI|nr:hypothetical protein O1611_g6860 [Lasiodiplodia mahajangana]
MEACLPAMALSRASQPMIPAGARSPAMLQPAMPIAIPMATATATATERAATSLDTQAAVPLCPSSEG